MLRRKILDSLIQRKKGNNKKCLIITGARQVGKTYIIRYFGERYYDSFIELNFVENPSYKKIFEGDLDIETIISNISLYAKNNELIPHKTLILLDEIQTCPNARVALKFFAQNQRFDVIASGSMLGLNYEGVASYPTGYVEFMEMYPLSFEEFLWANNVGDNVLKIIRKCFEDKTKVNDAMHLRLLDLFKQYIVVGGMPNVVDSFVKNHNYDEVLKLQRNILIDYRNDIAKYALPSDKVKATACFENIPSQLAKENKKFTYKNFDKGGRSSKYLGSINWLIDAGIANICYNLSSFNLPLIAYKEENNFKLYMADTGLLVSMLDEDTNVQIIEGNLGIYKGAIFENVIAQILKTNGNNLYFYKRNHTLEIDFVLSKKGKIVPLEVKAYNNRAKSLSTLLSENPDIEGIKLIYGNVGKVENKITLPLYMAMFL